VLQNPNCVLRVFIAWRMSDVPASAHGSVSSYTNVFAEDGRLVAAGTSQLLFTEIPR
jgi:hypothetical protein